MIFSVDGKVRGKGEVENLTSLLVVVILCFLLVLFSMGEIVELS